MKLVLVLFTLEILRMSAPYITWTISDRLLDDSLFSKIFIENLLPSLLIKDSKNDNLMFPECYFRSVRSGGHISL